MNKEERMVAIKMEDKRPKRIFLWTLAGATLLGVFVGFASAWMEDSLSMNGWLTGFMQCFEEVSVYVGMISTILSTIAVILLYKQARKLYEQWDEDEEETLAKIDMKLNVALIIANANIIITYMFMVVGVSHVTDIETNGLPQLTEVLVFFGGVAAAMALMIAGNAKIVNFQKEMNPEKEGSAYDFNFTKKWMNSSDEAEKLLNYKAAFAAYKTTNMICLILWMICVFGVMTWKWDILPGLMVSIIWLTTFLRCSIEAVRLSAHASKIQE